MEVKTCSKFCSAMGMSLSNKNLEETLEEKKMNMVAPMLPPIAPSQHMNKKSRSALILDKALEYELRYRHRDLDPNGVNLKKLRRTISNRLSAQRSRHKKTSYIETLEKNFSDMEKRVCILSVQLQVQKDKHEELLQEQAELQKIFQTHLKESKLRELEIEHNLEELKRLKELAKTKNRNNADNNYNPDFSHKVEEALRNLRFRIQPYTSLGFYQKGMQKQECDQFGYEGHSGSRGRTPPSTGEGMAKECDERKMKTKEEGDVETIDQFINFEALETDD